jgi:dihydroflavonol-4-reductase
MKAFVTGATGFIGARLAAGLRARGDDVVALVRNPSRASALSQLGCTLVEGDLDDTAAIRRAVQGSDAAFHAAAVYKVGIAKSERPSVFAANVGGTERVLDAAISAGVARIVYVSTVNCFGNTRGQIVDETYRRAGNDFVSCYDETKYLAHEVAEERIRQGAPIIIVQPSGVYGPGDHSELGTIIDQARSGTLKFISFPELGMVMAHVDDIAEGIILAHDKGRLGESYVLGGDVVRLRDVVRTAAEIAGRRPPRMVMPTPFIKAGIPMAPLVTRMMGLPPNLRELIRASDGVTYWATDAKARRELGYSSRDLRTGLTQTFAQRAAQPAAAG